MSAGSRWHVDVSLKLRAGGESIHSRKKDPHKVCELPPVTATIII